MDWEIREYRETDDFAAVRACLVELQEFERNLDARVPAGDAIADAYLDGLFRRCARFAGQLFVAEADGAIVGFVSVLGSCRSDAPDDDPEPFAYVDDLVVMPLYRGRGYGRALLSQAERYATALGRRTLRLRVKGGNHSARDFYARAGYAEYEVVLEKQVVGGNRSADA
jgi:GNAT superfamily N-acetyltransferase